VIGIKMKMMSSISEFFVDLGSQHALLVTSTCRDGEVLLNSDSIINYWRSKADDVSEEFI
jgi:hypothetical protein